MRHSFSRSPQTNELSTENRPLNEYVRDNHLINFYRSVPFGLYFFFTLLMFDWDPFNCRPVVFFPRVMQGAAWFLSVVVIGINMFFVAEYVVSFVLTLVYNVCQYVMLYINDVRNLLLGERMRSPLIANYMH